jgi:hypothetical protein
MDIDNEINIDHPFKGFDRNSGACRGCRSFSDKSPLGSRFQGLLQELEIHARAQGKEGFTGVSGNIMPTDSSDFRFRRRMRPGVCEHRKLNPKKGLNVTIDQSR